MTRNDDYLYGRFKIDQRFAHAKYRPLNRLCMSCAIPTIVYCHRYQLLRMNDRVSIYKPARLFNYPGKDHPLMTFLPIIIVKYLVSRPSRNSSA